MNTNPSPPSPPHIKSVVITGAASGLGKELALRFGKKHWNVCIADIHEARGLETLNEVSNQSDLPHFYTHCNVRSLNDINEMKKKAIAAFGQIDLLINNAGVASAGPIDLIDIETWDWMIDINLMGVVRGCKSFVPVFKQQGFGHIVNIASMAGLLTPPAMADYNVAKAGVIALSETLRAELAPYNIQTSVVCPSFFKTNLGESMRTPNQPSSIDIDRLMGKSEISAIDIADQIFNAVEDNEFWILPHDAANAAWHLKQTNQAAYFEANVAIAESLHRKDPTVTTSAINE